MRNRGSLSLLLAVWLGLQAQPLSYALFVEPAAKKSPAKILFYYVDGLRPNTVDAMVEEGKLPFIKDTFYKKGSRFKHFFCLFPSNTVVSNGMLLTGKWPENSGLKTQSFFERFRTRKKSLFKKIFRIRDFYPRQKNLLTDTEVAPQLLKEYRVSALYDYLEEGFHTGVVAISPYPAPLAWPHVASNVVDRPYLVTAEAAEKIDDINGEYALRYMATDRRGRFFLVWFPAMDEEQHRNEWGQFGSARERLENVDRWMEKINSAILKLDPDAPLYTIIFSDHGAIGGKDGRYNQPYHIARDLFYQTLKMNVRGPDFSITHPGTSPDSFAYVGNMGRGQAKIYLPAKDAFSGDWSRPNTFYELERYGLGPNRNPVNLIEVLSLLNLQNLNAFPGQTDPHPVEFVIVKINPKVIYIRKSDGSEAMITTKRTEQGDIYQYLPVTGFHQSETGGLVFTKTNSRDPFGYLHLPAFAAAVENFYSAAEWLQMTYSSDYPDAVTAIAKSMNWSEALSPHAPSQDPDIVLSAMPGWNFRIEPVNGADHGYLSRESMLSTLMMSGPKIKAGVIETPHRVIELAPTLMEILGYRGKTDFDVPPMRDIYEG